MGVDDVCEWVASLGLDPGAFKANTLTGVDILDLSAEEMESELGLRGNALWKLRSAVNRAR